MTTNQINYQKAQAEIAERAANTRATQLENEMTDLANRQEKFWHYGISEPGDTTITKAFPLEAYRRGIDEAGRFLGLLNPLSKLGGGSITPSTTVIKIKGSK